MTKDVCFRLIRVPYEESESAIRFLKCLVVFALWLYMYSFLKNHEKNLRIISSCKNFMHYINLRALYLVKISANLCDFSASSWGSIWFSAPLQR